MVLRFQTRSGADIPVDASGIEATLKNEFDGWRVTWLDARKAPLFVLLDGTSHEMEQGVGGWFSLPKKATKKTKHAVGVGTVTIFADADTKEPLLPWLRVLPANMTEEDFGAIVRDLRTLAFELSAYRVMSIESRNPSQPGGAMPLLERWLTRAQLAVDCASTFMKQLSLIERMPSRHLEVQSRAVRRHRAVGPAAMRHLNRIPDSRRVVCVPTLTETSDTPERIFMEHVARRLRDDMTLLADVLRVRTDALSDAKTEHESATTQRVPNAAVPASLTAHRDDVLADTDRLLSMLEELRDLLPDYAPGPIGGLSRPMTNRLLLSTDYGPVAHAWMDYLRTGGEVGGSDKLNQLTERSIHNTPTLYERWVTIRLYSALVDRGFQPPNGDPSLLDLMEVDNRFVRLKSEAGLQLSAMFDDQQLFVTLYHDRWIEELNIRPDLLIEAEYAGERQRWVFDSKYKDYGVPAPGYQRDGEEAHGSHFLADLVGVAENKYRRRLGAAVAAIVHPDERPQFSYWDDSQTRTDRPCEAPSPHSLVALHLLPGPLCDAQITKLFRLLFAYHLGLYSVCWRCGVEATSDRLVAVGVAGSTFRCTACASAWVSHRCARCKTAILGFGESSFHRVVTDDSWSVHCPRCDDTVKWRY